MRRRAAKVDRNIGEQMVSVEEMSQVVCYDGESGEIRWKKKVGARGVVGKLAGGKNSGGYPMMKYRGYSFFHHRIAIAFCTGSWPELEVDHIDGKKDNNCLCNLREVSPCDNARNKKRYKNNTSGVSGVRFRNKKPTWHVYISAGGREKYLGAYGNLLDAAAARRSQELALGYHENHGRTA